MLLYGKYYNEPDEEKEKTSFLFKMKKTDYWFSLDVRVILGEIENNQMNS